MALGRYNRRTIDEASGAVVPGAEVRFYNQVSGSPVVAYSDAAGTTPIGSMVTSGPAGEVEVFLPPGRYRVTVSVGGFQVEEITHEPVVGALGVVDPSAAGQYLAVLPTPGTAGVIHVATDGTVSVLPATTGAVKGEATVRTTGYTLSAALHNIFRTTNGDITVTVPNESTLDLSRPSSEVYMHHIRHTGAGVLIITPASGVAVQAPRGGVLSLSEAGQTITISKDTTAPNLWFVYGQTDAE